MIEIKEGTELDSAIAEAIGTNTSLKRFWPSTDLNDAFYAAEAAGLFTVVRDGPEVHLAKTIDGQWEILTGGSAMGYMTREATPALAICAAILKSKSEHSMRLPNGSSLVGYVAEGVESTGPKRT